MSRTRLRVLLTNQAKAHEYALAAPWPFRDEYVQGMNSTAWQRARREARLPDVRIHDLRHTYATRLRAAGVAEEDRAALLGHALRTLPEHYASADIGHLVGFANRVLDRVGTRTILRAASG